MKILTESICTEGLLGIGLEGIVDKVTDAAFIYVVMTNTKTPFSKLSKLVTGQPYNHVSVTFDPKYNTLYTYALKTKENGTEGGFKTETRKMLKGADYETYKVAITEAVKRKLEKAVAKLVKDPSVTRYNRLGLVNAMFNKEWIKREDATQLICSEFVVLLLREVGIDIAKDQVPARSVRTI